MQTELNAAGKNTRTAVCPAMSSRVNSPPSAVRRLNSGHGVPGAMMLTAADRVP